MIQCSNCRFENADDARVCAHCGLALPASAGPSAPAAAPKLPDWMQATEGGTDREQLPGPTGVAGAVAMAATLPVQVRRSRVPVLNVAGQYGPGTTAGSGAPESGAEAPGGQGVPGKRRSNRLRLVLLIAILIVVLVALAFYFLR